LGVLVALMMLIHRMKPPIKSDWTVLGVARLTRRVTIMPGVTIELKDNETLNDILKDT
jgi:ribosomal protein S19E (S16A)